MDAESLEAVKQAYEANLRQLRTLLDAQARLLTVAEQTAAETRVELERLAEALCPKLVDNLRKGDPLGLSQVPARALADAVLRDVQARLARLSAGEVAGRSVGRLYEEATRQVARLEQELATTRQELATKQAALEQAELRVAVLQQALEDSQRRLGQRQVSPATPAPAAQGQPPSEPLPGIPSAGEQQPEPGEGEWLPEWVREWQRKKTYERDVVLLQVLAETGVARRKRAAELFAARLGLEPSGGGISRAFQRLTRLGVAEVIEVRTETSGRSTHLLRLTERGRDAYRLLFHADPAPSQTTELLKRHKSPEHALLNLEAADLLREAGYEVDVFPGQIELPGGRLFAPDLAASRGGRTIFVEVERATRKAPDERGRKWDNYYDATGGQFYIVVADRSALDVIKSEILFWAGRRPLVLWMTSVSEARGRKGDAVWLFKRGKPK